MQTDSSASATYLASRSASEFTTTVLIPSSRHARCTRSAISPRLAIRILSNGLSDGASAKGCSADHEHRLAELDRLAVLHENRLDRSRGVGLDLVHELQRFDDAQRIALLDRVADLHKRLGPRRSGAIETA